MISLQVEDTEEDALASCPSQTSDTFGKHGIPHGFH